VAARKSAEALNRSTGTNIAGQAARPWQIATAVDARQSIVAGMRVASFRTATIMYKPRHNGLQIIEL
jgi:hypothetical protein